MFKGQWSSVQMDFLTKIKDIFFKAGEFESEVDGVKVDLRESYVKLTNCGDGYKPEKCGPIVKEKTRDMISEDSSDLPEGWTRFKLQRATGGICDTYVQNPEGKKFDRQKKIDQYLEKVNSNLKITFLPPPKAIKPGKTTDITKYMIKAKKAPSDKQPEFSADINIEEEKENICENLTKERKFEDVEDPVAEKSQQRNTKRDSTVGKIKRKVPNEDTTKKRKKPNIVESLSVSLNEESQCQENYTSSASEEEVKEDFNQSITSTCIEECSNISEVSDEFVAEGVAEVDEDEDEEAPDHQLPAIDDLPPGWCRKEANKVFSKNELIIIVQAPDGKQFDSQKKLNSYLARNKMQLKISIDGPIENRVTSEETSCSSKEKTDSISQQQDEVKEVKKRGKPKKEETAVTNRNLTNDDIDEDCDREFCHQDRCYIEEIDKFMKETGLNLKAFPPTKGDGNCWFRAIADQVVIQNIPDKARNHRALRLEVCDHVKMLPEDIQETTIAIVFNGKKRGLNEMVARQRKAGQWVDDGGIMVMLTAQYLGRNIHLYSYPRETPDNTWPYSLTKIDAGPGAEKYPPVTVFFYDKHYQTLQPDPDSPNEGEDNKNQ